MKPNTIKTIGLCVALTVTISADADIAWFFNVEYSSGARSGGIFETNGAISDLSGSGVVDFDPGVLHRFFWDSNQSFETVGFLDTTEYQNTRLRWNRETQAVESIWKGNPSVTGWPLQWGSGQSGQDIYQLQLSGSPTIRDGDGDPNSSDPSEVGQIVSLAIYPYTTNGIIWSFHVDFSSGASAHGRFLSDGGLITLLQSSNPLDFDPSALLQFTWLGSSGFTTAVEGSSEYQDVRFTWDPATNSVTSIWKGSPSATGWPLQWGTGQAGHDIFQLQLNGSPTIRDSDGSPASSNPTEVGSISNISIVPW